MRRFAFMVAALAPLFTLTACEDGPNQTYNPAPNGAGNVWNGPGSAGLPEGGTYSGNGSQQYDASFGGQNANVTCTADQAKAIWHNAFQQPILPPGIAGGLDIAGGYNGDGNANYTPGQPYKYDETKETWIGATLEQAQSILCTADPDSIYYGITSTAGWGNGCPACELSVLYNPNSRKITDLLFQYGYVGTMNATSTDGKTQYALGLNNLPWTATTSAGTTQITLNWNDSAALNKTANELYDAYRNTYAPTFPPDTDCQAAGHCIIGNNYTAGGYFWFTEINAVMFVTNTLAPQPAASTITLVDLGLLKLLPFSLGTNMLKFDAEGPLSITSNVANSGGTCTYKLGMNFGDFDKQCLEPSSDATQNTIAKNKLFGAIAHSDEAYEFDIQGVDPQFVATQADTTVISDTQRPGSNDIAYELTVDQEALGKIANDWFKNDPTTGMEDFHGLGMVTLEMANLVQKYMQANHGVNTQLGDADCIANPAAPATPGKVCSGIEGIVTTAPPVASDGVTPLVPANMLVNALGANALNVESGYGVGLKPSTWVLDFCSVTGNPATGTGYAGCEGGSYTGPLGGYYFDSIQWAVSQSFGSNPVPDDVASRRFYFKQFILAAVKYFQTASNYDATLAQIDANPVDDNQVFFDSAGGGFENGNYVFRNNVNSGMQPPTVFNIATNLTTSVLNNLTFARWNFRGDKALYNVLNENPGTDQPGAEPLYIMNMTGSPVLQAVYGAGAAGYACATNTNKTKCSGILGPTDPVSGQPLFAPYGPAFGQSFLNIAANGYAPSASAMQVDPKGYELIQSAMVTIPIWSNPFDPTTATANDKTVSILMPFVPAGAGGGGVAGFPVTIDGSRDKFYNTNETVLNSSENLAGSSLDYTIDWENIPVTTTSGTQNQNVVRAVESQSYLGLIMACAQPSTTVSGTQDILAVRMYDNAATILDWIANHPGAVASCGVQIKYSIYGNYADYISFNNNGVRFGLNPGFGGSVVSDGTVFDPNVIPGLGQ
ncbi:MAG TPA: hypothetical protein VF765_01360 [Polyangiaceae bacterium]